MKRIVVSLTTVALATTIAAGYAKQEKGVIVVHEWGTVTTHHASDGTPRGRLNHVTGTDTLPRFVHRYEPPGSGNDPERSLVKTALVAGRPDVTMRLETPVIYFYPPRGETSLPPFQVSVRFRGGVLNEFYPNADASVAPDVEADGPIAFASLRPSWNGERLDSSVVGRLLWRGVTLRDSVPLTPTTSHVWLAPRQVHASGVTTDGESERYLFYRGVAHLDAVLQTRLTSSDVSLLAPRDLRWMPSASMLVPRVWLVDILPNGSAAFRERDGLAIDAAGPSHELARLPLFGAKDYGPGKLADLRAAMKQALTAAGLYEEEAEAMLETWRSSYFQTPGLRLFYLVPNEWTEHFLPLRISTPHRLTRVLVGRIDIERGLGN